MRLSVQMEDYLRTIHDLERAEGRALTSRIAETMRVSQASATNMAKRLAKIGLVEHEAYRGATLTTAGQRIAVEIIRHHRLLELYLAQALGVPWDRVHSEADRLEHHISEELEDAIAQALGNPTRDPHGDPIPAADLTWPEDPADPMDRAQAGQTVRIVRVRDQAPQTLRNLREQGLVPGAIARVVSQDPALGVVNLDLDGRTLHLSLAMAAAILVEPAATAGVSA